MKTFPWQEREDYQISSWLNALLNVINNEALF